MSASDPLAGLYPFLHGGRKDAAAEQEALLESVRRKSRHSIEVKEAFYREHAAAVVDCARAIAAVYRRGGRMFTMGNGGSSCDAAHFAVEFQHPITAGRPALPAMNLVMDQAMFSAVANDVGVEHVFVRQLQAHARPGDGLIGFSTSGNSANLMAAFAKARELGLTTIGLAGGDGGQMRRSGLLDHCLVVPTDSIHRVQEVHVSLYHILWDLVHTLLADDRGAAGSGKAAAPAPPSPLPEGEGGPETSPSPRGGGVGERAARPARPTPRARAYAKALRRDPTEAEQRLWYHLRAGRLNGHKFRRQHPVGPYIVDFACLAAGLVIELDGGQHMERSAQDTRRTAYLESRGLRVLRFWNDQVLKETDAVLEAILQALEARGPFGSSPQTTPR